MCISYVTAFIWSTANNNDETTVWVAICPAFALITTLWPKPCWFPASHIHVWLYICMASFQRVNPWKPHSFNIPPQQLTLSVRYSANRILMAPNHQQLPCWPDYNENNATKHAYRIAATKRWCKWDGFNSSHIPTRNICLTISIQA